ncbi:MAG: SCO family protein [Flavobacteriaceae bacterium]|nr:SCO family protein [Flavobacteriaceae bacterium]MDG2314578.1 SCO family protein [Flavobacteriaceae bacterium]
MIQFFEKYKRFAGIMIVVSAIIIVLFYRALKPIPVLPIYQPAMVATELVDEELQHIKKYHQIADFSFINQNGKTITQNDYKGFIYVADFFFTTCPTICPIMTDNMVFLQQQLTDIPNVKLLSHTVTPEIDSVPVLKKYALKKGVDDSRWNLVTGEKKEIYSLARASYMVVKTSVDGGPFDMIHTENFVLVDPQGRIRGYYDGTQTEAMQTLLNDIDVLQQELKK